MNRLRRPVDVVCASVGLVVLWPLLAALALVILICSGRPVFFRQTRVGRHGVRFRIWKFRTMRAGATGLAITTAGDVRVTKIGAWLRRFKLDELPQLFNVLRGDMSVVGPRPEVPEYVDPGSPLWQAVLRVRPGITDLATLVYRDEENLLRTSGEAVSSQLSAFSSGPVRGCDPAGLEDGPGIPGPYKAADTERLYREVILPAKLRLNLAYLQRRCFRQDVRLIWLTLRYSLSPKGFHPGRIRKAFQTGVEYGGRLHSISSAIDR